jgi:signal transduction histidine kinase/ActR/RegA family two-component response regulator
LKRFLETGEGPVLNTRIEITAVHRDGHEFPIELSITPIRLGSRYIFSAFVHDITPRTQAREAVRLAKDEAERANRAKSEFLSRMSHELRTPLNAILGFGQLLEMESLSPGERESVEHILKGGRHLLDLINEVLDIARIEEGRLTVSLEPVSVNEVVQESLDLVAPLAAAQDVRLTGGAAGLPNRFVVADRQRLKQVLLNLLSNAVKYNRKGGVASLSFEEMPEGRLRIKVHDSGPGIAPEKLERVFTPFERLGAEQTGIEGTGLGLALSKRLSEVMGGTLGLESAVGRGSTFWIELPQTDNPVDRVTQVGAPPPAVADPDVSRNARVILYIEDNLSNLELIQRLIAHRPEVRLLPAMQGRLGLDLAREHRPALILLDLHLPDIPGHEVLQRLQADPETRHIPVVVISADATPGQIDRLLAAGAQAYLTKPLDLKTLLAVLERGPAGLPGQPIAPDR